MAEYRLTRRKWHSYCLIDLIHEDSEDLLFRPRVLNDLACLSIWIRFIGHLISIPSGPHLTGWIYVVMYAYL
jgi:hypothetical protein